ncbi:hypothetical protein [Pectobacterium carotovorum]|uniref:hypothetical protein n=3 Tax=Pectobacterium carotovorum TaxID=554 RepID=UPI00301AB974
MESLSQTHNGQGDNVARDKNLFIENYNNFINSTVPEDLRQPVKEILSDISNRKIIDAKKKIDLISSIKNQTKEVDDLFLLLRIKSDLVEDPNSYSDFSVLHDITLSSNNEMIKDLSLSLLLRLEFNKFGKGRMMERYDATEVKGPFSRALLLELTLSKDVLLERASTGKHSFTEEELIGLIAGLFRVKCFKVALDVATFLIDYFPSYNSSVIHLFAKGMLINQDIIGEDYWLISQKEKERISSLIEETLSLFNDSEGNDLRLFNIIIPCYFFTKESDERLRNICIRNIEFVDRIDHELANNFRVLHLNDQDQESHPVNIIRKCRNDNDYKEEIAKGILSNDVISLSDFILAKELIDDSSLVEWIDKGGLLQTGKGKLSELFSKLKLSLYIEKNDSSRKNSKIIDDIIDDILICEDSDFKYINSVFIYNISEELIDLERNNQLCNILKKYFDNKGDYWCSPVVQQFLIELYETGLYKEFSSLYNVVDNKDKPILIHTMALSTYIFHNDMENALLLVEEHSDSEDLDFLRLTLHIYDKCGKTQEIESTVNNISYKKLTKPTNSLLLLSEKIISLGYKKFGHDLAINLFLESPEKNYMFVSRICLQIMMSKKNNQEFIYSDDVDGVVCGVRYNDTGKELTKLIVIGTSQNSNYFISSDSPVAKVLLDSKLDEVNKLGMKKIILKERMPAYVAVFRLAHEIRNESNDGSDIFQSISVPEDPEEIINVIKDILPKVEQKYNLHLNERFPVNFRLDMIAKGEQVKASMISLTDTKIKIKDFEPGGEDIEGDVSTDIFTICYICINSLVDFFIDKDIKFLLIEEDAKAIKLWLEAIEEDEYKTIGVNENGKIYINTSESIKNHHGEFIKNLDAIQKQIRIHYPKIGNIPDELNMFRGIVGDDYLKNIYTSITNNTQYFSADLIANMFFNKTLNMRVIDFHKYINEAVLHISYRDRERGVFLHSIGMYPYPLSIDDIHNLAYSKNDEEGYFLGEIIKRYSGRFNEKIDLYAFMGQLFFRYLQKSYTNNQIFNVNLKNTDLSFINPYGAKIDRIFYICCSAIIKIKNGSTCEENLARFLVFLLCEFTPNPNFLNLILWLSSKFSSGHFLSISKLNKCLEELLMIEK